MFVNIITIPGTGALSSIRSLLIKNILLLITAILAILIISNTKYKFLNMAVLHVRQFTRHVPGSDLLLCVQ